MVVDRYTKGVLTVIAVCLVYQCVMSMGKVVEAQQLTRPSVGMLTSWQAQPVVIVGWGEMAWNGEITVNTRQRNGNSVTDPTPPIQRPMPVSVESAPPLKLTYGADQPLPVSINGVRNTSGAWDAINSHVEPQPMGATPGQPRR
jgi:hypothetical protein